MVMMMAMIVQMKTIIKITIMIMRTCMEGGISSLTVIGPNGENV